MRGNEIEGREFVLTGSMWTTRQWIEDAIKRLGGYIGQRITYRTSYLVQANSQWGRKTTKYTQANNLGVKIIDEETLYKWIIQSNDYEAGKGNPNGRP